MRKRAPKRTPEPASTKQSALRLTIFEALCTAERGLRDSNPFDLAEASKAMLRASRRLSSMADSITIDRNKED